MEVLTTTSAAHRRAAGAVVVGVFEKGHLGAAAADVDNASKGALRQLIKQGDINGNLGSCLRLHGLSGVRAKRVFVVGLGRKSAYGVRALRRAAQTAANALKSTRVRDAVSYLGIDPIKDCDDYYRARLTVETIGSALYRFTETKSGRTPRAPALRKIGIAALTRAHASAALKGAEHGLAISHGMSVARDLGNLPPNICTPNYLAQTARKLASKSAKLTTKVLNETEIKRLKMNSFLSVTAGTVLPAKLIVMQYKGGGKQKPLVLIGKGITFDAGGISLKPGPGMDEMKFDMCGAAAVIGTMSTIARLKLPINLTVIVPTCENMPGSKATRPGDIVTSMSGKTIEILNTDAEGRLILCDAITYSRRFKPDTVIDVATLTGACVVALGKHMTAVMTRRDKLASEITDAGIAADDRSWRLPMAEEYEQQLKSNFADFANVGGRDGGASTAACFLGKFADGLNWAHLDIAGTAWRGGAAKGSSGRPVPLLSEFVLRRANAIPGRGKG